MRSKLELCFIYYWLTQNKYGRPEGRYLLEGGGGWGDNAKKEGESNKMEIAKYYCLYLL